MIYHKYYDADTRERRENRSQRNTKCLSLRNVPNRAVFQNALRHATRQAVKHFRRANLNNVPRGTTKAARSEALWHGCVLIPILPLSLSSDISAQESLFYTRLVSSMITLDITNATGLLQFVWFLMFSSSFFAFAWILSLSQYTIRLSIIFRLARESTNSISDAASIDTK